MQNNTKKQLSEFLKRLADSLNISESRYKQAEERYQSVGKWLGRTESSVAATKPTIYPQGSIRLVRLSNRSPKQRSTTLILSAKCVFLKIKSVRNN